MPDHGVIGDLPALRTSPAMQATMSHGYVDPIFACREGLDCVCYPGIWSGKEFWEFSGFSGIKHVSGGRHCTWFFGS